MSNWIPINKQQHLHASYQLQGGYQHSQAHRFIPALMSELDLLIGDFPLAFRQTDTGFELVVLLSLHQPTNLYVNDKGVWLAPYVPALFRGYPFGLLQTDSQDWILGVDEQAQQFSHQPTGHPQRLFSDQGELTPSATELLGFLHQCQQQRERTQEQVNQLVNAGVLAPWPLPWNATPESSDGQLIDGLYRIDMARLQSLDASQAQALLTSGALKIVYAQAFSECRINELNQRYQRCLGHTNTSVDELDLEHFFGEGDDSIKF